MLCMQATALGSLFGCSNNNVLDEWYGEYTLLSTEEKCTLALNNDKTYIIKYLDNAYSGSYTYYQTEGDTGSDLEHAIYPGDYYPTDGSGRAYGITLLGGDSFTNLPDSFKKFFMNNGESNQHLFVHTFYNTDSFVKYGVTAKSVAIDSSKKYKEIVYYPDRISACSVSGEPLYNKENDPDLHFIKISQKKGRQILVGGTPENPKVN